MWLKYLPLVEFAYNALHHRSLEMSPFKELYRHDCLIYYRFVDPNLLVPTTKTTLEEMDKQVQAIRQLLKRASERQRSYTDLHRSSCTFT